MKFTRLFALILFCCFDYYFLEAGHAPPPPPPLLVLRQIMIKMSDVGPLKVPTGNLGYKDFYSTFMCPNKETIASMSFSYSESRTYSDPRPVYYDIAATCTDGSSSPPLDMNSGNVVYSAYVRMYKSDVNLSQGLQIESGLKCPVGQSLIGFSKVNYGDIWPNRGGYGGFLKSVTFHCGVVQWRKCYEDLSYCQP